MERKRCEQISPATPATTATPDGSDRTPVCQLCQTPNAHRYQVVSFNPQPPQSEEREYLLCVGCARGERKRLLESSSESNLEGWTRKQLIGELDRFFAASGVFEICRRCHEQGTGCCPPSCRVMGAAGCNPDNHYGKTVFCATFICSALLNAITECDGEIGRELKRIKRELGPAEFHLYEMITRVPAQSREPLRPLVLPLRYPRPTGLNGEKIQAKLHRLSDEVLQIRRQWREQEIREFGDL